MKNNYSDHLNADEHVIQVIDRHPIGLLAIAAPTAVAVLGVLIGFYALGRYGSSISQVGSTHIAFFGLSALLVLVLLIGMASYRIYSQNTLVITNQCLIQYSQNGLVSRTRSQMALLHVADAKAVQNGIIPTTFNYGTITVETSGEEENFVFRMAPNPQKIVDVILDLHRTNTPSV